MRPPPFHDPARIGALRLPETAAAVAAGRAAGLPPADEDATRAVLLLVDVQVDFVHPDGALAVSGAVEDTRRTVEWIHRNAGRIHAIAASLDTHVPRQIFFESWWVDAGGDPPAPFTTIRSADVAAGRWRPVHDEAWSRAYVERLEREGRKELVIWPYHALLGTAGHALVPSVHEAIVYHAAARRTSPVFLSKGSVPRTEHYSVLEPEVAVPDEPGGGRNDALVRWLAGHDRIYLAGQAKSHCVLETLRSLLRALEGDPPAIGKIRVLVDCMSSVAHPEIDLDAMADEALAAAARRGVLLVRSTDPVD